ncbi:unnamed protein product [Cylindrotheca closterium]|uniref:Probable cytosolic iron-sulfur protein assembly protein CIAO1 homolog n=1 Tax=Cylindrotheca closterium TaxID=2856 RepID=A0AAD2FLV9_9STRA|nr:unnamed protein product [Cylindrotheca closterium]
MSAEKATQDHNPSLSLTESLFPPPKAFGSGAKPALQYRSDSPCWDCVFSRNGKWLAACFGAPETCVRVWEQKDDGWQLHSTLEGIHTKTIRSIAFAPISANDVIAAASFDGSVSIWELTNDQQNKEWECTTQLEGHESEVKCVVWNSTGSLLATSGRDKSVWVWETFLDGTIGGSSDNDFECIAVLSGHEGDVKCVRFAESHGQWGDGDEVLLSAGYDDTIRVWAEDSGDWYCALVIEGIHADTIWSLAVAPGSGRMVSSSADGSIAIMKNFTILERREMFPDQSSCSNGFWKCVGKLGDAHSSTVYSVDYAPARAGHGRIASAGGDNRVQIYREVMGSTSDAPLFTVDSSLQIGHGDINCVRWHPSDGSILCAACDDGSVRILKFLV